MAMTIIERVGGYVAPPIVPTKVSKRMGFNFLPPGTVQLHDGGKWGLYFNGAHNVSYLVMDTGKEWRVKPILGRVRVNYAQGVMAQKPCCQDN